MKSAACDVTGTVQVPASIKPIPARVGLYLQLQPYGVSLGYQPQDLLSLFLLCINTVHLYLMVPA